jgi:hypothetical protein
MVWWRLSLATRLGHMGKVHLLCRLNKVSLP